MPTERAILLLRISTSADRQLAYRSLNACASSRFATDDANGPTTRPQAAQEVVVVARSCSAFARAHATESYPRTSSAGASPQGQPEQSPEIARTPSWVFLEGGEVAL